MPKPREVSVDSWLATKPEEPRLLVTLKPVPEDDEHVYVTPALPGGACACSGGVRIAKDSIAGVTATDQKRECCGGSATLVEIRFKPKATISLTDLFDQITGMQPSHMQHAQMHHPGGADHAMPHQMMSTMARATPIGPQDPLGTSCFCHNGTAYCCRFVGFPYGWVCWNAGIKCGPLNATNHMFS